MQNTKTFDFKNMTKDGAIQVARQLGLKRDWMRVTKPELVGMLRGFDTEQLLAAARRACEAEGESFDAEDWLTDADEQAAEEESKPAAEPRASQRAASADKAEGGEPEVTEVAAMLARLMSKGKAHVSEDDVRKIVAPMLDELSIDICNRLGAATGEAIKQAMADVPARQVVVTINDLQPVTLDGYTRPEFAKVLRRAAAGVNQLLVGPAGCGKTHLAAQVAQALQRPFASVSCSAGMSESALQGWLLPTGDSGKFEYVESDFVRIYENGGVFLIDEIDAADENMLLWLNQALANGRFNLPQRTGRTEVIRHPDFVCIAAANTYGKGGTAMYAGRNQLDEATIDRFRAGTMALDYDAEFERQAVNPDLLAWARQVRDCIERNQMRRVLSTRFLLDSTKLMAAGESLAEVKETFFLGWKAEEVSKIVTY
ncbi:MAG: AAA family ATPase [Aquabacterium sp.]